MDYWQIVNYMSVCDGDFMINKGLQQLYLCYSSWAFKLMQPQLWLQTPPLCQCCSYSVHMCNIRCQSVGGQLAHLTKLRSFIRKRNRHAINQSIKDFTVVGGQLAHLTKLRSFIRKRNRQRMTNKQSIIRKLSRICHCAK